MPRNNLFIIALLFVLICIPNTAQTRASIDTPVAKLRSIDKITARTLTFDVKTGSTVKFGSLYIKVQACRRAPDIEEPESAAFMQIWEVADEGLEQEKAEWVFSGWMFASSPGLSAMDHPIYDVWVLECAAPEQAPAETVTGEAKEGEGVVADDAIPAQPGITAE